MTSKIVSAHQEHVARARAVLLQTKRPKLVAQSLFSLVARAGGFKCHRDMVAEFTKCKPVIRELVATGVVEFFHVEGGTSYYIVNGIDPATENTLHTKAEDARVEPNIRVMDDSTHARANALLSRRAWRINRARLEKLEKALIDGYIFDDFKFIKIEDPERSEKHKEQMYICSTLKAQLEKNPANVFYFDVNDDARGRFYIKGGKVSPHNGKVCRWLWTGEDEVTLDHRTSFAQNFALLTGSDWGKYCGIGTSTDCDFWAGALAPYGVEIKPHSLTRQACKAYGMKRFYGAGDETAEAECVEWLKKAVGEGETDQAGADAVLDALRKFGETLKKFGAKARTFAQSFVDWGDFPHWETPSGFRAWKNDYNTHKSIVWNSGENDTAYYPKSMTCIVRTKVICTQPVHESDKSVLVATCANILQSLDASIMAHTIVRYHERTGRVLFPVHDSYTVKAEDADILRECVIDSMRYVADCPQMRNLRKELGLVPVKVITGKAQPSSQMINLDMRMMNPLDEE